MDVNRVFSLHLNQLVKIFINDLSGQPYRAWVFSELIYSHVIIQKTVYGTRFDCFIFLIMSFKVIDAQYSEFFIIGLLY